MQVQIRGFRIELGEIESVLCEHEAVNQSVVVVFEEQPGDKRLVAYIVPAADSVLNVPELRDYLRVRLPEYMLPHFFVELEAVPLTHNGKVDRRALPPPQIDRQFEEGYVAPRNHVEKDISILWQKLLGIENVGIHDNFFEIGGHSLLLIKMLDTLNKTFEKELSIVELFRNPTISTLSDFLSQKRVSGTNFEKTFNLAKMQREALMRRRPMTSSQGKKGE
jgi:hypothetical protein